MTAERPGRTLANRLRRTDQRIKRRHGLNRCLYRGQGGVKPGSMGVISDNLIHMANMWQREMLGRHNRGRKNTKRNLRSVPLPLAYARGSVPGARPSGSGPETSETRHLVPRSLRFRAGRMPTLLGHTTCFKTLSALYYCLSLFGSQSRLV